MPTTDPRTRLIALLMRVAPDLAARVWLVDDLRELPADVKGQCLDVIGTEAADRGLKRDGSMSKYGCQLDELADALEMDD